MYVHQLYSHQLGQLFFSSWIFLPARVVVYQLDALASYQLDALWAQTAFLTGLRCIFYPLEQYVYQLDVLLSQAACFPTLTFSSSSKRLFAALFYQVELFFGIAHVNQVLLPTSLRRCSTSWIFYFGICLGTHQFVCQLNHFFTSWIPIRFFGFVTSWIAY